MGLLIATVKARDLVVGGATLLGLGASLIEMGIGLRIVAGAIKPLSEVKWTSLVKAVVGMGALTAYLTAMGSMLVLAQGVADTMLTFQNGLAIAAMGGGLWVLVQGVCALAGLITENVDDGTLNTTKLEYATTAMKTLMILMTAMSVLSSKTKFSSGAAALAMAGAMNAVAVAAAALTLVPVDSLKKAAGVLGGLSAAMAALGYFGSAGWSEGAGIFLMADALMAVAGACLMMGKVDWGELKKAGASLVVLSAIGLVLSKFAGPVSFLNVSTGMLAMSASLLVLAPAIQLIGMAKPEAVSQSLWIFADTMMAMFAGGMLLTCIPELALGLSTLAAAFTKFGKGMLYLAGAGAIFGALALFADPLCTAIINAAPDIEAALVAVVTLICGAINQSAEPIGEAFTTLCKVLIQTAIDLIGWAWSGEGGEGEGIKGALEELGKNIWDGIRDIFSPFSGGMFQQRNIAFKFNPDFKPQRINVADVFTFSGAKDDAEKEGKEIGENVANGGAKGVEENKARATGAVQDMVDDTIDTAKKGYDVNSPSKIFEEIGRYITEGLAIGIQDPGALSGALAAMQTVAKSIRSVFTTFWGIHSPSQLAEEDGQNVVEGLRLGIGDPDLRSQLYDASYDSASQVRDAVGAALDEAKKTASDKMLELYSIMKADHLMPDGTLPSGKAGLGANRYQQAVQDYEKANAKEDARNTPYLGADWKPSSMWDKATEALQKYQSGEIKAKDALKGLTGEAKDWVSKQIGSALGLEGLDPSEYADLILEQYSGYLPDDSTGASTASSGKKSSSKGKTLAETIADKYTKELKANKYLQNAADKEYSLWEAGEGNTASIEALIQKKGETLAKSIELQTARVDIAQRQYDELVSRVGASDDKTKEAYNTLLDEKKNLLDLQQARFENTYKAAIERYESDDKLAQTEYQLWTDTYEKTASVTEKSNKNIETINKRLATQSEKTALAEKAWVETKDALGEASLVTQQAYRDYLEARQEQLELENELDKAQLAAFDDLSSFYDSRISMAQKRMTLLDKLYNDGDLSGREDAYASAVEQYGEDSIEARRAATQGTMTALMGVNSALTSMRWQMSKVTAMQQKYQTALEQAGGNRYDETVMAAYEDMMETRSTFADYVGNLADAFNVSDATKKAMMQFGDAIAQNWKPIQNGFMAVVKKMNPKLVQGFSDLFGLYMKDGASETVAAATNTVVAAMSGDWASAVASGLTAVLDVVGTDFGQTLTEAISTALKNAFSGNGLFAQLLMKLFGSIDLGGSGSSGGFLSNLWQWLKGGASAAKSFLGGASTAAAGASGAAKIIPVLNSVGTATANVASVAKAAGVAKAAATTAGAATSGVLAKVGMGVAKVASGLGPHGLLAAAVIAGTVAVGTAVVKNWDKVKEAVGNAWSWIKEKASGLWDGMKSIGGNLMSGLATGVKSAAKFGLKVALGPAYAIISGFKHILGIHSPSKVMAGIGEYVIEGLTRGIVSTEGEAEKGMDEVGGAVIRSALATTNAIADYLSTDNHPSITPVVDLSDAARGSAWLNSAFADRKGTISMAATVTGRMARRAETPSRNQNGYETAPAQTQSNRDVVEAVKTLGERIDRVAESVKGMKVVMNGRKFVGEIRSDIDDVVGDIIEKGH
jgi:phage tail tape measure protein, TP901 family